MKKVNILIRLYILGQFVVEESKKEISFYCMLSTIFSPLFLFSPSFEQFFRDFPTVANHFDTEVGGKREMD